STHRNCSSDLTSLPTWSVSVLASSIDRVRPNAPDSRPKSEAVGLAAPRSTLLIIALDTPDRSARSGSDQPRFSRSTLIRAPRRVSRVSRVSNIIDIIDAIAYDLL